MHNDPIYLLEPVFHLLNWLFREYGHYLYLALCYAAVAFIAWILSGGLRRKCPRPPHITTIIVTRPPAKPPAEPPPIIGSDADRFPETDQDSFAA